MLTSMQGGGGDLAVPDKPRPLTACEQTAAVHTVLRLAASPADARDVLDMLDLTRHAHTMRRPR